MGVWIETRGRKSSDRSQCVTPHVGVWIETRIARETGNCLRTSRPTWACGLKLNVEGVKVTIDVTPHVGVWIETVLRMAILLIALVTPHVGVWIET